MRKQLYGCTNVFLQHVPQVDLVMTAKMNVETVIRCMHVTMSVVFVPMVAMQDSKESFVKHVSQLFYCINWISDL